MRPFEGIRVLDITEAHVGPSATVLLGDMGADVIKVERLRGDRVRLWGKVVGFGDGTGYERDDDVPAQFFAINRNKRSISVNLKSEEGRKLVLTLAKTADVFVQNMRPGAIEGLGLSYENIRKVNPEIIYASGSGWGIEGPDAFKRAVDITGQARSGIMAQTGAPDHPIPAGPAICDHLAGLYLSYAIISALFVRERSGIGQRVDVSMLGSSIAIHAREITQYLFDGGPVINWRRQFGVFWNAFKTSDIWVCIGGLNEDLWPDFCKLLDLEHVCDNPKFATHKARVKHEAELLVILNEAFLKKSGRELLDQFEAAGVIVAPVQTLDQVVEDPQALANDYVTDYDYPGRGPVRVVGFPVTMSQTPWKIHRPCPELGEHTREVMLEIGYTEDEINRLLQKNICREARPA
jgi:crotonobetainyl-CoA:carnitine CoA-transferase CaiB-like acyl-CoA transferase